MTQNCIDCGAVIPPNKYKTRCYSCWKKTQIKESKPRCPYLTRYKACSGEDCVCCEIYQEAQSETFGTYNKFF